MLLPDTTKPINTYRLRAFALFHFVSMWLSMVMLVVFALIPLFPIVQLMVIGFAPFFPGIFFYAVVALLFVINWRCLWPMVWKIETVDKGLLFCTLFQRHFVSWSSLTDVQSERLGDKTSYVVFYRDGKSIRFLSGMDRQGELLALIRQHVPERFLTVEKGSRQNKISLFIQSFFLLWSVGFTAGGIIELVQILRKALSGDLSHALWIAHAMLLLVAGVTVGCATILRAKSVRITDRGLNIETWICELDITWQDIKTMWRLPFGTTIVVKCRKGWFILGEELSRFDELSQFITSIRRS